VVQHSYQALWSALKLNQAAYTIAPQTPETGCGFRDGCDLAQVKDKSEIIFSIINKSQAILE